MTRPRRYVVQVPAPCSDRGVGALTFYFRAAVIASAILLAA